MEVEVVGDTSYMKRHLLVWDIAIIINHTSTGRISLDPTDVKHLDHVRSFFDLGIDSIYDYYRPMVF
jgi:hypothetical protein